jgi:hypothetical protein
MDIVHQKRRTLRSFYINTRNMIIVRLVTPQSKYESYIDL